MAEAVEEPLARACSELAQAMTRPGALVEVMQCLAVEVARILGQPCAAAVVLDTDGRPRPIAATEDAVAGLVTVELRLGEGPTLEALDGDVIVFDDDVGPERWPRYGAEARGAGVHGVLAVPMRGAERPVGVLTVMLTEPHHWQVTDVAAAEVLADLAGVYAAQQTELARVQRTADQLQTALESRVTIEQAKGVLVGELGCTVEQAYAMLRDHARRNSVSLQSVAHAVVHLGLRPPAPARGSQAFRAGGKQQEQGGSV